ncbi:MAG: UDP-N-acetylmuramate dehydrogenase [Planctomycetota bacterium]|nr:UDP-N-acetylmuramate dehydrogenase [Planctomycetota bacterium]
MKLPPFIRENVPLAGLTTFSIGGPVRWLAEPANREELRIALALAGELGVEARPLGGGSNILAADAGFAGMAIRLSPEGEFGTLHPDPVSSLRWRAGAAVGLPALLLALADRGVAGAEFLAGIPGRLGGAAIMNAGGRDRGFGQFIAEVEVFSLAGGEQVLKGADLSFGYRRSSLAGGMAIGFVLVFPAADAPGAVRARMRDFLERKGRTQPLGQPSAGCVFRNPPGASAGALLDRAGCKKFREGGAGVSGRHANFIVNLGGAAARDAAVLARRMRLAAAADSGVWLEPEIVLWGDEPAFSFLTEGVA